MKKGQFAMEYFLIVGFSLVIITPMIFLLYSEYGKVRSDVQYEHIIELSRELIFQAEKIYYQGPPSQTTIRAYFPPGITSISAYSESSKGSYLEFEFEDSPGKTSLWSRVPLEVDLKPFSGHHVIVLTVKEGDGGQYVLIKDKED